MYLYWLHRPEHTNILTEGYIGVSTRPQRRLWEHQNTSENQHLINAISKYKDITQTILMIGPEDYCYEIEERLRPNEQIGWNINKGGYKPPSHKGRKQTKEHKMKRANAITGHKAPKLIEYNKTRKGLISCYDSNGKYIRVPKEEFQQRNDLIGIARKIA